MYCATKSAGNALAAIHVFVAECGYLTKKFKYFPALLLPKIFGAEMSEAVCSNEVLGLAVSDNRC